MIECGRDLAREDLALLFDRAGIEHLFRISAEHAGREMPRGDEASEQAEVIEIARKPRDPAPASEIAAFPIIAAVLIEMRGDEIVIEMDVATIIGGAEKAIEGSVIGKMLSGGELQLQERDVRRVEIDRIDARRVCHEIAHDVAAARRDRQYAALRGQLQRFHVGTRVFPNLRIDHRTESECESAFKDARRAERPVLVHRFAQQISTRRFENFGRNVHWDLRSPAHFAPDLLPITRLQ